MKKILLPVLVTVGSISFSSAQTAKIQKSKLNHAVSSSVAQQRKNERTLARTNSERIVLSDKITAVPASVLASRKANGKN